MAGGYLTRYASHGLLSLMTGGGENPASGTDPVADILLKAHLSRHWGGGAVDAAGVWAPREYLLALLDRVEAEGVEAVRTEVQTREASPSGQVFLALCTSDPGDVATALTSEVTAAGYQRQAVAFSSPKVGEQFVYESGTAATVSLDSSAVFGPFTDMAGSAVPVTHMALVTAPTGTDLAVLVVWPLDFPVTAEQGDCLLTPAGTLTIKVS